MSVPVASPNGHPDLKIFSHRSGIEEDWRCPRAGYLAYGYLNTGIYRKPRPVWLDVGVAVHIGLAGFLLKKAPLDAVNEALKYFDECGQSFFLPYNRFVEQRALIEVLLWSFAFYTLPSFLRNFTVLWVEQEVLKEEKIKIYDGREITLIRMSRPDALCMDNATSEIALISWKTIDDLTEWRRMFYKHDLQGLLEMAFSERMLAERQEMSKKAIANVHQMLTEGISLTPQVLDSLSKAAEDLKRTPAVQVDYVQTIFLQKGKRIREDAEGAEAGEHYDSDDISWEQTIGGEWRQDTFLLYPWIANEKAKADEKWGLEGGACPSHSWKFRFTKPGQKSFNTVGKSFDRSFIMLDEGMSNYREPGEPDTWTAMRFFAQQLTEKKVFPSTIMPDLPNPMEKVIIWDEPAYRNRKMMDRIERQTARTEAARANRTIFVNEYLDKNGGQDFLKVLDANFEQRLISCSHPWRCQFTEICFGADIEWGKVPEKFVRRFPHHEPEAVYFRERGWVEEKPEVDPFRNY